MKKRILWIGLSLPWVLTLAVSGLKGNVDQWAPLLIKAHSEGRCIPVLSYRYPDADEETAYKVQKAVVEKRLLEDKSAGFKAGLTSKGAQKRFGINGPVSGVLFASGQYTGSPVIPLSKFKDPRIETEIGFVIRKPITQPLKDTTALRKYIRAVMPVIELPDLCFEEPQKLTALDIIAANISAVGFIKGKEKDVTGLNLNHISVTLYRDGKEVNRGKGSDALGDQWKAALWLVNTVVNQGWTIEPGQIIITGALGKMIPGKPGYYTADYGDFGTINFKIK